MTDAEKIDKLDGLYAYDGGCISSGIYDPDLKNYFKVNAEETRVLLTALAKQYLVCTVNTYTLSDIKGLIDWAEYTLDIDL